MQGSPKRELVLSYSSMNLQIEKIEKKYYGKCLTSFT